MPRPVLITDSTADIPSDVAGAAGILVARATYAFDEHTFHDGDQPSGAMYMRMTAEGRAPRPFGTAEAAFKPLYQAVLDAGNLPVCVVAPFDVNPSFTTAIAAQLALDDADIKVVNAGVHSAGLCSLLLTLAGGIDAGWDRARVLAAVDDFGPQCDTLFVPATVEWLERSGRLPLIEDRLGEMDEGAPVVRVGTRITGVARATDQASSLQDAVRRAVTRVSDGRAIVATVAHAAAPGLAEEAAEMVRRERTVARLVVTELSATIGSQLGPGAVGVGIAPALEER